MSRYHDKGEPMRLADAFAYRRAFRFWRMRARQHKCAWLGMKHRAEGAEANLEAAIARASSAESSLAAMRQRAEEAETKCKMIDDWYMNALGALDEEIKGHVKALNEIDVIKLGRSAALARAERAEACLRSLDPFFEFSSIPSGAEGFLVQGDNPALIEAFAEAASILSSPPADASTMGGDHIADASTKVGERERLPDDIRAKGWMVAVHNDYRLNGDMYTFWLFTKDNRAVKGEGKTDLDALNQVRASLADMGQKS